MSANLSWIPAKKTCFVDYFREIFFNSGTFTKLTASTLFRILCVSSSLTVLCPFAWAPLHCTASLGAVRLLKQINVTKEVKFRRRWIEMALGGSRLSWLLLIWFQQSRRAWLSWRGSKSREQPRWTPVKKKTKKKHSSQHNFKLQDRFDWRNCCTTFNIDANAV